MSFVRVVQTKLVRQSVFSRTARRFQKFGFSTLPASPADSSKLRNVAIIAHVDHGKTTMVDELLKISGGNEGKQMDRQMDSNDLEKERGITILSKVTSVDWKGHQINLVDTPGHADFGGEVERIMDMVDGVVLLCDVAEGPMPQTKFVLSKALQAGVTPAVVLNKVDRNEDRADEAEVEIMELFDNLGANEKQMEYQTFFASGKSGWAVRDLEDERKDVSCILDGIVEAVPAPVVKGDASAPFSMLCTMLDNDPHFGRMLCGRVHSGALKSGEIVYALDLEGNKIEEGRVLKITSNRGISKQELSEAKAGDIVSIAGFADATVSHTLCADPEQEPIPSTPIDPPTISVTITVNDSPFQGVDGGTKLTGSDIQKRLQSEQETNVALTVKKTGESTFEVGGRGELGLGVLIETMRREGYELSVSPPKVLFKDCTETGERLEPVEEVTVDVDDEYAGTVIEKMSARQADLVSYNNGENGKSRLIFTIATRTLMGYPSTFKQETRGTGTMNRIFHAYEPYKGHVPQQRKGAIVSQSEGVCTAYALEGLQARGTLMVNVGDKCYEGMVIGEANKEYDLDCSPTRAKKLTNMRAAGKEDGYLVSKPREMSLEELISWIQRDEMLEVTPKAVRVRKAIRETNVRLKAKKTKTGVYAE